jgi:RNA polymerase sigma-70 factor (ECF subfamily)
MRSEDMGYLRPARSIAPLPAAEAACLAAFDRELDYLFETLRRLGAGPREIEDLAQDVFLVLHRNWPALDMSRPLRPYLFGVAFRVVSAQRRRRAREVPHAALDPEDGGLNPERSLQGRESVAILTAALAKIPARRRAVIVMHELDDVPVVEVARNLKLSRFGTYARLRKARKELAVAVRRLVKEGIVT